jgi:hypothetical protein
VSGICGVVRAGIYFIQAKVGVIAIIRHLPTGVRHAGEPSCVLAAPEMGVTAIIEIRGIFSVQVPRAVLGSIVCGEGEEERLFWGQGGGPTDAPLSVEELRRIRRE